MKNYYKDLVFSVPGAWKPESIAVDWVSDNLYVIDSLGQKIDIFAIEGIFFSIRFPKIIF